MRADQLSMAVLCRDLGLLFVLNPATGSTAIGNLLREKYGGERLPADDTPSVRKKHSTLQELMDAGLVSAEERRRLERSQSLRSARLDLREAAGARPERVADPDSWLYGPRGLGRAEEVHWIQEHSFSAWIRRRFLRNSLLRVVLGRSPSVYGRFVDGVDVVLRFERLQEDFDAAIRSLSGTPSEIPRVNVSAARGPLHYRDEYDLLSRTLVRIEQRADLERFGYSF